MSEWIEVTLAETPRMKTLRVLLPVRRIEGISGIEGDGRVTISFTDGDGHPRVYHTPYEEVAAQLGLRPVVYPPGTTAAGHCLTHEQRHALWETYNNLFAAAALLDQSILSPASDLRMWANTIRKAIGDDMFDGN